MMNIKKEIEDDLNQLMNKFIIHKNEYLNFEIQAKISNYLADFYAPTGKIYNYLVISEYPNLYITIKEHKYSESLIRIELTRFERLKKLEKLNKIDD